MHTQLPGAASRSGTHLPKPALRALPLGLPDSLTKATHPPQEPLCATTLRLVDVLVAQVALVKTHNTRSCSLPRSGRLGLCLSPGFVVSHPPCTSSPRTPQSCFTFSHAVFHSFAGKPAANSTPHSSLQAALFLSVVGFDEKTPLKPPPNKGTTHNKSVGSSSGKQSGESGLLSHQPKKKSKANRTQSTAQEPTAMENVRKNGERRRTFTSPSTYMRSTGRRTRN